MAILLTGYSGFLGTALRDKIKDPIVLLGRKASSGAVHHYASFDHQENYRSALSAVDVIIHCAARAHVMNESAADPLALYRQVNVAGTLNLAKQAAEAGVKRFVFISSIKVNGEETTMCKPYTAADLPAPQDPYGISKSEAETQLLDLAEQTSIEVVIIRPTLVYGPGVKGNFASLVKLVEKGLPLPLGCADKNLRSLVSIDNLVDLIVCCIYHPKAANEIFLAADGEDLSTVDMLKKLAKHMNRKSYLLPVPESLMRFTGRILGKQAVIDRLFGSLQVDISKTQRLLGWRPLISVDEGFARMVEGYLNS